MPDVSHILDARDRGKLTCQNCLFWEPNLGPDGWGECRASLPAFHPNVTEEEMGGYSVSDRFIGHFPMTTGTEDWCAHFIEDPS